MCTDDWRLVGLRRGVCLGVLVALWCAPSVGLAQQGSPNFRDMSIEDLMSVEIVSASRKEQPAWDAAAAVFVITQEDIRQSGMRTIPDLLRLAPGVQVAEINANKWAVSIRGFNGLYANKLLVLVDGRSVYTRLYSGVLWDAEGLLFDDIDRIEVIRGPGAAIWGANAMNGVINIVTKGAGDTQGVLARVDAGLAGEHANLRYGGRVGLGHYRIYAQWAGRHESLIAPGVDANDESSYASTGFRLDRSTARDALTLTGAANVGRLRALWRNLDSETAASIPFSADTSDAQGGHALGRWTRTRPGGASLQVQSSIDFVGRQETLGDYSRRAFDVDAQYRAPLGARHDLVVGAGYRFTREGLVGGIGSSLTPTVDRASLVTAFVHDDIDVLDERLILTLGTQVQYDSYSGGGVQPTARIMWKLRPRQRLWAGVSRALRTPSVIERGIRVTYPPLPSGAGIPLVVTIASGPSPATERVVDVEVGYRRDVGRSASIDATAFVGRYARLQTLEPSDPTFELSPTPHLALTTLLANELDATTRGFEVAAHWAPISRWRVDASYTAFGLTPRPSAISRDAAATVADGDAPRSQWQVRTVWSPVARATVNAGLFHVGRLEQLEVPAYTRIDMGASWQITDALSATLIGQNLLDQAHPEFADGSTFVRATQVRRSATLRLRWVFP